MEYVALTRLAALRKLNSDRDWVNRDLYRLMYREDLYVVAYEAIKSAPGNMTPGVDGSTLDGFSLETIREIIGEMRTEQFDFKPVRRVLIEKPGKAGEMRPLGIPSPRDRMVQQVMLMILEAIYDSPEGAYFHESSHGFRPRRGPHSALREFRRKWSGTNWIIEGDIKGCFEHVDHHVLIRILRRKIDDERFINLIWKLIRAGYVWLKERQDSLVGTPQGTIISPILANIYLDRLDRKVEEIRARYETGEGKRLNPAYRKIQRERAELIETHGEHHPEAKALEQQMRDLPSLDPKDPNFIRVRYLRYADDWIVGVCGPKSLADEITVEIKRFLAEELKLTLSEEKTRITNAKEEEAQFLGTLLKVGRGSNAEAKVTVSTNASGKQFKRRSTGMETVMLAPIKRLIQRLARRGFCDGHGEPASKKAWTILDVDQIIHLFSSVNRGILNYYRFTDNFGELRRIQYILQFSLAMTLGQKLRVPKAQVFRKFGKSLTYSVVGKDGRERTVSFHRNTDWHKNRDAFRVADPTVDLVQMQVRLRTRSKLGKACAICGALDGVEMHHVRAIRKMDASKRKGFTKVMAAMNRKQVPVCRDCHGKIHRGEFDGLKLADLAYDPT